ncbi:MAG: F0F1 ATP synthase subunit delta [Lutibacter sp.]|nr:F0F1 ATP synthase subunit delta [Lutibacter sp.]MDT8417769.1 F0F1 ATP synthase subunit delta [Lutibacter sp.]
MKIDWFTVIAQVINFVILVWLLKRFLYKPILNAIDDREQKVNSQLAEAENKKLEAKLERDEYIEKNENFDKEKQELTEKAIAETKEERERLLKEARQDVDAMKAKHSAAIKEMQNNLIKKYGQNMKEDILSISKKTLSDLASENLEAQVVSIFIKQLDDLKDDERNHFMQSFKSDTNPVLVKSAFSLPTELQNKIKIAVNKILESETTFEFEVKPNLIAGIEMTANGYKLAWSISEYLNSLKKNMVESGEEN